MYVYNLYLCLGVENAHLYVYIYIYIYASINGPASTINAAGLVTYTKNKVLI